MRRSKLGRSVLIFYIVASIGFAVWYITPEPKERASSYARIAPNVWQINDTLWVVHGSDTTRFVVKLD